MNEPLLIGGLDEVGVGAVCGPAVVAITTFSKGAAPVAGARDSKKLSRQQRARLFPEIVRAATWIGLGWCSSDEIDTLGLGRAWALACARALEGVPRLEVLIVDGQRAAPNYLGNQRAVVKGDDLHWQVSCASIIAKQLRDQEMAYLDQFYPGYNFSKNAGYGTEQHRQAILARGLSPFHRLSFLHGFLNARQPPTVNQS